MPPLKHNRHNFQGWLKALNALFEAIGCGKHYATTQHDPESWREYFMDGDTPEIAFEDELDAVYRIV